MAAGGTTTDDREAAAKKKPQPRQLFYVNIGVMTTEDRDERDGMDPQADAALWTLLGRQEPPRRVSPYFARRVWREVALAEERHATGWWTRLRCVLPAPAFSRRTALWSGVLSGACAVGLFCLSEVGAPPTFAPVPHATPPGPVLVSHGDEAPGRPVEDNSVPVQEAEVIADLDNILQREESRLWTDDNSTARF